MSKLPRDLSGRDVVAALCRTDFHILHQRGSHIVLRSDPRRITLVVPDHKTLRIGTLRAILHQAGLGIDEFLRLL